MALFKQLANIIKSLWRFWSIDPCLYVKKSMKGVVYAALYVDDNLMVGDIAAIDNAIEALKSKGLVLKIMDGLQDYLPCKI